MLIADAQVHVWAPNSRERPWLPGREPHRATALGADELLRLMDEAGVHRAILVPPSWDCDRNDLVLDAAREHPDRYAAMGRIDPDAPDAREAIAAWPSSGMIGMRFSATNPRHVAQLKSGELDWMWAAIERAQVPIDVLCPQAHMAAMGRVAERHPGLKLSLCHLGLVTGERDAIAFRDFDNVPPLAKYPNVMAKVSALPAYTSDRYPFRELLPYLRRIYDTFGPRRMFWGTDLARMPCSYRQAVTLFTEEIPWFTAEDKGWIMGRALCEWLGWRPPAPVSAA